MKLLRKIPVRYRACIGRRLAPHRLLMSEAMMQSWFDFPRKSLTRALLKRGIFTIDPDHPGWKANENSGTQQLTTSEVTNLAKYPVCIELESTPAELDTIPQARIDVVSQKHQENIQNLASRIGTVFECFDPDAVAIVQGYDSLNAVSRCLAIRQNLPLLSLENTAISDRMLWDNMSGITTNRNLAKNFYWRFRDTVRKSSAHSYCEELITKTKNKKLAEHTSPEKPFEKAGDKRPNVLFLGQVYTDSSVLFGIGEWKTPVQLMKELARLAHQMDFNLWIKLHPKEMTGLSPVIDQPYDKLTWRKLNSDPEFSDLAQIDDRIMIDHENEYDTYALMRSADAAVTLNSQAGLEAAIRGVPTVVTGEAFYGNLRFTLDAPHPELLEIQLKRALGMEEIDKNELTAEARIFTHIYFEKYCVNKSPADLAALVGRRCYGA